MPFDATNFGDDPKRRDLAILRAARAELVRMFDRAIAALEAERPKREARNPGSGNGTALLCRARVPGFNMHRSRAHIKVGR